MRQISIVVGALLLVAAALLAATGRFPNELASTQEGALLALSYLKEWAIWMAGIQTAALGGLAVLVFKGENRTPMNMSALQKFASLGAFVSLGLGLFCAAWILSALPSFAVRIHGHPSAGGPESADTPRLDSFYDIYERPLYGWMEEPGWSWARVELAYVMTVQHWFWAIGLICLGLYVFSNFVTPPEGNGSGAPPNPGRGRKR